MEQINKRNYQVGQVYTATGKTTDEMTNESRTMWQYDEKIIILDELQFRKTMGLLPNV